MGVLDWMGLIDDWNFWKASVDMVISLEVLEKGISCTVSCLTKNPPYAFLRRGSKAICPMAQICGM
jgi:hypothetical protein